MSNLKRQKIILKTLLLATSGFLLSFSFAAAKNFTIYNTTNVNQPYFSVNGTNGYVGIGMTNPATLLQITNNNWISASNSAGTGIVNMFKVNASDQIEVGAPLNIGSFEFSPDSGLVTFVDMPISATPAAGTPEGYVFKADGENIMTIYSEADGAGGVQNKRIGINTTAPNDTFSIGNSGAAPAGSSATGHNYTSTYLSTDNYALTNYGLVKTLIAGGSGSAVGYWTMNGTNIYNSNSGNVGIGTTGPEAKNDIIGATQGTITAYGSEVPGLILEQRNVAYGTTYAGAMLEFRQNNGTDTWTNGAILGIDNSGYSGELGFFTQPGGTTDPSGRRTRGASLAERMRIDKNGNVGIGTTNPVELLQVGKTNYGATTATTIRVEGYADGVSGEVPFGNLWLSNYEVGGGGVKLQASRYSDNYGARLDILVGKPSGLGGASRNLTNVFTILGNGNVGIGTTNPGAALDVVGAGKFSGNITVGSSSGLFISGVGYMVASGNTWLLRNWAGTGANVDVLDVVAAGNLKVSGAGPHYINTGNVGIGTTVPNDTFSIGNSGAAPAGSAATGHNYTSTYLSTDNYALTNYGLVKTLIAGGSGSAVGYWTMNGTNIYNSNSGNVGIGTTEPQYPLHIIKSATGQSTALLVQNQHAADGDSVSIDFSVAGSYLQTARMSAIRTGAGAIADITFSTWDTALVEKMRIKNNGNVGIGTTNPGAKLDVSGEINSGAVYRGDYLNSVQNRQAYYSFDGATIDTNQWYFSGTGVTQSSSLLFASGTGSWNQGVISKAVFHRSHNLVMEADVTPTISGGDLMIGFHDTGTNYSYANGNHYLYFYSNGSLMVYENAASMGGSGSWSVGTKYRIRVILKPGGGASYYVSSNGGRTWTIVWAGNTSITATPVRLGIAFTGGAFTVDNMEVYSTDGPNYLYGNLGLINEVSGSVGVGTTGPGYKLDVNGDGRYTSKLWLDAAEGLGVYGIRGRNTNEQIEMYNRVSIGSPSGWQAFPQAPAYGLSTYGGANFATNQGSVGIGTTAPNDTFSIGNSGSAPAGSSATGHNYTSTYLSTDNYALTNYGLVKTLIAGGSGSSVGYWTMNGTNINNSNAGNVGIGTTAPGQKLDVSGNINYTGALYRNGIDQGFENGAVRVSYNQYGYITGTSRDNWNSNTGVTWSVYRTINTGIPWASRDAEEQEIMTAMGMAGIVNFQPAIVVAKVEWTGPLSWVSFPSQIWATGQTTVASYCKSLSGAALSGEWASGMTTSWGLCGAQHGVPAPGTYQHLHPSSDGAGSALVIWPAEVRGYFPLDRNNPKWGYWDNLPNDQGFISAGSTLTGLVRSTVSGNSWFTGGNVGIGTTAPGNMFQVGGTAAATRYFEINNVGSPNIRYDDNSALHGLTLTNRGIIAAGQGSYILFSNAAGAAAAESAASIAGISENATHTGATADGALTFNTALNSSLSERIRITSAGYVGIGTTAPNDTFSIGNSGSAPAGSSATGHNYTSTYLSTDNYALTNYGIVKTLINSYLSTTTPITGAYLPLAGGTMNGAIQMGTNNITNVGTLTASKITASTFDPLYTINGVNYSTFAPAISGGVREEYIGKIKLEKKNKSGEFEAVINFAEVPAGSDLWLWRKVVEFNKDNIDIAITPYGGFAQVYYLIDGNHLVFRSDRSAEISYRLIGRRFDWRKWPSRSEDQTTKGVEIK